MIEDNYIDNYEGDGHDEFLKGIFGTKESRTAKREVRQDKKEAKVDAKKAKTAIKLNESAAKIESMKGDLEAQKALLGAAGSGVAGDLSAKSDSPNYMLYGGIGAGVIFLAVVLYFVFKKKA